MGTVPGIAKLVPDTEMFTTSDGDATTVALAEADAANKLLAALVALAAIAYVPGEVPDGAASVNVAEPL